MQLRPLRISALAIGLALILTSCASSTKIVNQWVNPEYRAPNFKRIVVVGVTKQPSLRRTFEDEFVSRLTTEGVDAVPSYRYIPEDGEVAEARLQEAVRQANADAALITRLVTVEKKTEVVPGFISRLRRSPLVFTLDIPPSGTVITSPREFINTTSTSRRPACTT